MDKILIIARREFLEVLRTRTFWFSAVVPVAVTAGALVWGAGRVGRMGAGNAQVVRALGAFMYFFVMFMSIMSTSQMLLTSLIEEKSSRVVEVLLSAVSPMELMAGKILGLVAVGLTNAAIFVTVLGAVAGWSGMLIAPSPVMIALFLIYYLLGFSMFASLFAGIGAAFNALKDAQAVTIPIAILMVLPFMCWTQIARNPNGALAVGLSIFPPTAPTVMILRIAVLPAPPWLEVAASLLLLAIAVPCAVWAAAKVFRTGILLYGKPPKLGEILRWVRNG